jgi:hypothetical protein
MSNAKLGSSYDDKFSGMELGKLRATVAEQAEEIERLRGLVKMGEAVVEDFMPNPRHIGRCALGDHARLNRFLCETAALKDNGGD